VRGTDLKFDHLIIRDVEGERRTDARDLPLRVGTSSECELRLPGPGGEPVALLDLLDGMPFVQPVGRNTSLTIKLEVRLEDSAYVTRPPDIPEDVEILDEEAIAPTAFSRAADTAARIHKEKESPLKYIVGTGLAVLLLASYLLFSAKSIEFEIEPPEPDSFNIDGGWFRLPVGDRVLLRKGTYTVNVQKQGYYDVQQSFVVGDEQSMTLNLSMRKKPGRLLVKVEPAIDAIVTVNESQVGKAPFGPVELEPGEHAVRVESDRFLPFSGTVDMPGLDLLENLNVQLVPRWAQVTVESEPSGANILAGDEVVGTTPATIELLEGSHELTVSKDGFSAWDGAVVAEPCCTAVASHRPAARRRSPHGKYNSAWCKYHGKWPVSRPVTPHVVACT
jgi:hypothetical protein